MHKETLVLLKSMHYDLYAHVSGLDQREAPQIVRKQCVATSMNQATEWGMHAFQSKFPRVKDTIIYDKNNMILPFNFHTNVIGVNHILNFSSLGLRAVPWIGHENNNLSYTSMLKIFF